MSRMSRLALGVAALACFAAEGAGAGVPAPVKEVLKQNGIKRPDVGSVTGKLWDIADDISAKLGRPAPRKDVVEAYMKALPNANQSTANTQYARWTTYHGAAEALRAARLAETEARRQAKDGEMTEAQKARAEEKAKKAEQDAIDKAAKAQAKIEADAKREAEKAEKAAERERVKAEKAEAKRVEAEAKSKAKMDARAAKDAEKAAKEVEKANAAAAAKAQTENQPAA